MTGARFYPYSVKVERFAHEPDKMLIRFHQNSLVLTRQQACYVKTILSNLLKGIIDDQACSECPNYEGCLNDAR